MSQTTGANQDAHQNKIEQATELAKEPALSIAVLRPLHRQFTLKLFVAALTVALAFALSLVFFLQYNEKAQTLIQMQLLPLEQQVKQLESLQRANVIVDDLLRGNSEQNWLKLHGELIAVNRELLRVESPNRTIFQQWLNQNKAAEKTVDRAEQNKSRNQQLKQSGIIQLQLMLFSITTINDKQKAQEKSLYQQLQAGNSDGTVTVESANDYVKAVKQLHHVNQVKGLTSELLTGFEGLTFSTSQADFDLLRLAVEQLFSQVKLLDDTETAVAEFIKQVDSFKSIAETDHQALAKWQGYLRLSQSYSLDLVPQQQQITALLSTPRIDFSNDTVGVIGQFLANYQIDLNDDQIGLILVGTITVLLTLFCVLLWRVHRQLKKAGQQTLKVVEQAILGQHGDKIAANSVETQLIIEQILQIETPLHSEDDYQVLQKKCAVNEDLIEKQNVALLKLAESSNVQQLEKAEQVTEHFTHELQSYDYLKEKMLPLLAPKGVLSNSDKGEESLEVNHSAMLLSDVYERLEQFKLASYMQLNDAVLSLNDGNLLEQLHAILLNKQAMQLAKNNQFYFSYDEQVIAEVNLDVQLFQHLGSLLIDLSLAQSHNAYCHLHLSLQDKNAGQQNIHFTLKVSDKTLTDVPSTISQLTHIHESIEQNSPLIPVFEVIFSKLHGENFTAHHTDEGYQLSFDMPFAIATKVNIQRAVSEQEAQNNTPLSDTVFLLVSDNKILATILQKYVLSCTKKFEHISRLDSVSQRLAPKQLTRQQVDMIVIDGKIASTALVSIERHIADLPKSMQPKLMVLQSSELSYQQFGCYSQAEQPLCKGELLQNIKHLLLVDEMNNARYCASELQLNSAETNGFQVLLAVHAPQHYQQLQQLLQWLGFAVYFVADDASQTKQWRTGRYNILITEFSENAFISMAVPTATEIGVFSLQEKMLVPEYSTKNSSIDFSQWHCGQLTTTANLAELTSCLQPWLKAEQSQQYSHQKSNWQSQLPLVAESLSSEDTTFNDDELVITEVVTNVSSDDNGDASFDFSRYLQHQGSVELALFMIEEYSRDNHQQLRDLGQAIEAKAPEKAMLSVERLLVNAKILACDDLEQLCLQWQQELNDNAELTGLAELVTDTQQVLYAIDSYGETI